VIVWQFTLVCYFDMVISKGSAFKLLERPLCPFPGINRFPHPFPPSPLTTTLQVMCVLCPQGVLQNVRFVFGTTPEAILRNKGCSSGEYPSILGGI